MADRKVLTADFIALKAKVKAEMLRRSYSGSVADYGGAGYDFTTAPADGGPLLGEHMKKNLEPMQAVNPDGLPSYPGGLDKQGQELMETKVTAWGTRAITDRAASDCKAGCTGTCFSSCTTGCYTGCSGCSGCGGCGGCSGCSGCGSGCADSCSGGCKESCKGCDGCSDCGISCGSGCSGGCKGGCQNTCNGCDGCTATCSDGNF